MRTTVNIANLRNTSSPQMTLKGYVNLNGDGEINIRSNWASKETYVLDFVVSYRTCVRHFID